MTYIDIKNRAFLVTLYNEKHRHYHTLDHIYDCLVKLEEYAEHVKMEKYIHEIIETAIWFHDSVYIPKSKKNEENSVKLFENAALGYMSKDVKKIIRESILATKTHTPKDYIEQVVCDIDLSILGAEQDVYISYRHNIVKEYNFIQCDKFSIGRAAFLNNMLQKTEIFHITYFKDLYEKQARQNMEWELNFLKNNKCLR